MKTQMTEQETTAATAANAMALELENAYARIDALISEKAALEATLEAYIAGDMSKAAAS